MKALTATFGEEQKSSHDESQQDSVRLSTEAAVLDQGIDFESKRFESLPVPDIQHYTAVPDFLTTSFYSYPIVVNEDGILQCISNWDVVQQTLDNGEEKIECLVIIPSEPSPEDTAIRKLASRVKTLAGKASYPEMLKGYKAVKQLLLESNNNLVTYTHGGSRQGEQYTGEKDNDLYLLLANRLGKGRDSIRKYDYHSKYVNDETLGHLHAEGATKGLFEDIYSGKIKLIQDCEEDELTDEEITEKVSEFVLSKFRGNEPEPEASEEEQVPDNSEETDKLPEGENDKEPEGEESGESEKTCEESEPELPVTLQDYQQEAHESWNEIMPFINIPAEEKVDFEAYYQKLQEHNEKVMELMACVKAQLDSTESS